MRSIGQIECLGRVSAHIHPVVEEHHDKEEVEGDKKLMHLMKQGHDTATEAKVWVDLTSMGLDGEKVVEARIKEIEYIWKKKVWTTLRRSEALENRWKLVKT